MSKIENIYRKVLQVFLQIVLLPVYCFLELFGIVPWVVFIILQCKSCDLLILFLVGLLGIPIWINLVLLASLLFYKIRGSELHYETYETGRYVTKTKKQYHDININGERGFYTTENSYNEPEVVETERSQSERFRAGVFFTFAVLIGVIKLVLSIIACFTNKFYIAIREPRENMLADTKFFYFGFAK